MKRRAERDAEHERHEQPGMQLQVGPILAGRPVDETTSIYHLTVLKFFVLTYAATWACFVAAAAVSRPSAPPGELSALQTGLLMLGTFAPSLVALGLTWLDRGASGAGKLLRPVLRTEVPVCW